MKYIFCLIIFCFSTLQSKAFQHDTIPCIIQSSGDILFLNLGKSDHPLKQGDFLAQEDKVILNDGSIISNYYKEKLGIGFYKPMDHDQWERPPTGWCSWYYYFKEITAEEVIRNVDWLSENLKDYGLKYIQIDDGWMNEIGKAEGYKPSDWYNSNKKFPAGMKDLADQIKKKGFSPGLWLSPQGHSDPIVLDLWPDTFLENDSSGYDISGFWGRYLIDPSSGEAHDYLRDLFTRMNGWGYEYYKIDGQPNILLEFQKQVDWMTKPGDPVELFRNTLSTIKSTIGEDRYLLGCWGTPEEGVGILDGARTGGDIGYNGGWYEVALRSTLKYLYLNNIVWHSDPDVILVREPTPINHAILWATFQAMSGQSMLLSDRMPDLSRSRVNILKKTMPATAIIPVDLYPQKNLKSVWDLKISHLNEDYDVVGIFNFVNQDDYAKFLSWESIGNNPDKKYHVFDFWEGKYLGAWAGGYYTKVLPGSVKLLGLREVKNGPQLISTSRHISQGYIDLKEVEYGSSRISGISKVIKDDPYSLFFAFPPGDEYEINKVKCNQEFTIINHGNWAELIVYPDKTEELHWSCEFIETGASSFSINAQANPPSGVAINTNQVLFRWYQPPPLAGHQVYLDGQLLGFTPHSEVLLDIDDLKMHRIEVNTVGWNGQANSKKLGLDFGLEDLLPKKLNLTDMKASKEFLEGPGPVDRRFFLYRKNQRLEYASPISNLMIGGIKYSTGIATHANSDFIYPLNNCFKEFTADIGIDDSSLEGSVIFKILCDDKEVYNSGIMTHKSPAKKIKINVRDVKELRLLVEDAGDGLTGDLANWADAYLWR